MLVAVLEKHFLSQEQRQAFLKCNIVCNNKGTNKLNFQEQYTRNSLLFVCGYGKLTLRDSQPHPHHQERLIYCNQ